ncbi:hypothetical protein ES703_96154 [subsurface metagenome]
MARGDMLESIQQSQTSFSPMISVLPHLGHFSNGGGILIGSIGKSSFFGGKISLHSQQYQKGIGVPKTRCREITQFHSKPFAQSNNRNLCFLGYHFIKSADSIIS